MTEFSSLAFDKQETVVLARRVAGGTASASDELAHALRATSIDVAVDARSSAGGSLALTVEESDDGDSWSEIEAVGTLARTGSASLTVTPTKEWLRVAWTGGGGWTIDITATGHATIEAGNIASSGGGTVSLTGATIALGSILNGYTSNANIVFDSALIDSDGYFNAGSGKIVVPTGLGGIYLVGLTISVGGIDAGSQSSFSARVRTAGNPADVIGPFSFTATTAGIAIVTGLYGTYAEGDDLAGRLGWSGGGTVNLNSTNTIMWCVYMGPTP